MAQLTEDPITRTATTLTFLPYRALICYLVCRPKATIATYRFPVVRDDMCYVLKVCNRTERV